MYCTIDDIINDTSEVTLQQLTDDETVPTTVNEDLVNSKIEETGNFINTYIKQVAILPITDPEDLSLLKKISVSLSVCDLYQRRLQTELTDNLIMRRKEALGMLKDIVKGDLKLNTPGPETAPNKIYFKVARRKPLFKENYFDI